MTARKYRTIALLGLLVFGLLVGGIPGSSSAWGPTAQSVLDLTCQGGTDGAVYVTDSGLEVRHSDETLEGNPFVNETTLAFENVTVSAADRASVAIRTATTDGICLAALDPTAASLQIEPAAGPRITVSDPIGNLAYGSMTYARDEGTVDLRYDASSAATLTIADDHFDPGQSIQVVAVDTGAHLTSGTVAGDGTLDLTLPAGEYRVDLEYASTTTATTTTDSPPPGGTTTTATTTTDSPPPGGTTTTTTTTTDSPPPGGTTTTTTTTTATTTTPPPSTTTPTSTTTSTRTTTDTATRTTTTPGRSVTTTTQTGPPSTPPGDGTTAAPRATVATTTLGSGGEHTTTVTSGGIGSNQTTTVTTTFSANATGIALPGWTGELVDYDPSPETVHVSGLLPLVILLWLFVIWLALKQDDDEARLLAIVVVFGALRATSDLFQVLLDGYVGIQAPLVLLNLLFEFLTATTFAAFAIAYTEQPEHSRTVGRTAVNGVTILGTVAITTNVLHGLVYTNVRISEGAFSYATADLAPLGWLLYAITVGAMVYGVGMLVRHFLRTSVHGLWRPVTIIATGIGLALGISIVELLNIGPVGAFDYSALGVNYLLLATTISLIGFGFQRLKPRGKQSILSDLEDAILILDDRGHIVEWNVAMKRRFPDVERNRSIESMLPMMLPAPSSRKPLTREMTVRLEPDNGERPTEPHSFEQGEAKPSDDTAPEAMRPNRDHDQRQESNDDWTLFEKGPTEEEPQPDESKSSDVVAPADGEAGASRALEEEPHHPETREPVSASAEPIESDGSPKTDRTHGTQLAPEIGSIEPDPDLVVTVDGDGADETEHRHFMISARSVLNETDDCLGYTVRFTDITNRKRQLLQLEAKHDVLDQFASAVTADLKEPLETAHDRAERTIETLDQSDGVESLDQSGLTGTLSSVGLVLESVGRLVEDILGLARDSELSANPERVSFGAVAETVWERLETDEQTLRVVSDGTLLADREHLERILTILFQNALEHGCKASQRPESGDDHACTVSVGLTADGFFVADDGPGVPETIRGRAFEPGVSSKPDGAGLGLPMARQRARAHGWTIEFAPAETGARVLIRGCETTPADGGDQ